MALFIQNRSNTRSLDENSEPAPNDVARELSPQQHGKQGTSADVSGG
jgi:hypothetical protein